jgi:toxin FitB
VKFLLDTNVISEPWKPRPNPAVLEWLAATDEDSIYLSVVTITELRHGIERLAAGRKRNHLDQWLSEVLARRFSGRILPIDFEIADACGKLAARSEKIGRPIEPRDAYIAATAEVHSLTLVTRNVGDFQPVLKSILNPWS